MRTEEVTNVQGIAAPASEVAARAVAEPPTHPAPAPAASAQAAPVVEAPSSPTGRRRRRLLLIIPIVLIVGAVAVKIATQYLYDSANFVMTDNAQVTGALVQVGSMNAGRLVQASLDVGQTVHKDQVIATVAVPQQVGVVPFSDQALMDQTGSSNAQVPVHSPIDGVVAARMANVGGTVTVGEAIYALVDPTQIWVEANIDEDQVSRVQPGQTVEITSAASGRTFTGHVSGVTPASAATFSLLPAQSLSGTFNKVTQWVPVKIDVDTRGAILPLGTSASVKIRVAGQ